ncbi:MAG TPA: enolase C-terminal domain-like protein [Thermoanaerobaculia bacterium]|nr:enolase C-terminal domain-like protein [Thermoanaerobaculia bacterium]
MRVERVSVRDVRFPTSRERDGSDSMNEGDYSATYVTLATDDGLEGHGLTFTNGRGNEICVAAVKALAHHLEGRVLDPFPSGMRSLVVDLTTDSQLRWLGPEKGVLQMATGALVNAAWDLQARRAGKPLWKLLVDLEPEELVGALDFSYVTDALTPGEAVTLLRERGAGKLEREKAHLEDGFPAYTTSTGWLGYPDEKVRRLCREAIAEGWTAFKMKVGPDLAANTRRAALMREEIGPGRRLMLDANQCWDVPEAIRQMEALAGFDPYWIEEPTSADDVLGHAAISKAVAPVGVATGEVCQNRVVFKQLLQARALRFVQVDACRMAGISEALVVILMAAKFGIPVCPHGGGVGLCEYVQHLSFFDAIALGGSGDEGICEYVDHLHEHFLDPCVVRSARYVAPEAPGTSIAMKPESLDTYEFPGGAAWRG